MIRHPLAWCVWGIAGLCAAFIDRNPLLQVLLMLVVINVGLPHRRNPAMRHWKIGLALAVVPILFSAALSRFGRHVIFTLPGIPIVGGAWSWEAVAYGASTGVALLLTVAVFATLQASVRSADLVALLPRPLYRAGTVFALSLAFACPACGDEVEGDLTPATTAMPCPSCGASCDLPEAGSLASSRAV